MRKLTLLGGAFFVASISLPTMASASPDLPVRFFNTIPDVCFQAARGKPPTPENAESLGLEIASDVPATVRAHFSRVPSWFRLKSQPKEVLVGIGDSPGACHVVLADTSETVEVRTKVAYLLKAGGFQMIQENTTPGSDVDMLFVSKAPDGYMLVSLQAPRQVVRHGIGDQGAVHVKLMPTAMFESMRQKR
ncbi:hypothetical protein [Novosphingobium sp. P6W]|uniref:hypothetical protein n=1 Tax=Novosphingobium sp. P6W TaxID=1609758 RepID=UPI000A794AE4|nr:hypothetical protein [Novosphingobium sp. P6W]